MVPFLGGPKFVAVWVVLSKVVNRVHTERWGVTEITTRPGHSLDWIVFCGYVRGGVNTRHGSRLAELTDRARVSGTRSLIATQ